MSFQDPFDADSTLDKAGCSCGAHISQAEHDKTAALSGDERMARVVESAVVLSCSAWLMCAPQLQPALSRVLSASNGS